MLTSEQKDRLITMIDDFVDQSKELTAYKLTLLYRNVFPNEKIYFKDVKELLFIYMVAEYDHVYGYINYTHPTEGWTDKLYFDAKLFPLLDYPSGKDLEDALEIKDLVKISTISNVASLEIILDQLRSV